MKAKKGEETWQELLEACQKVGKDKIIANLEVYHRQLENLEANLWSEPEHHAEARLLSYILLKQDETLIRLRQMTDDDIRISIETDKVGVHGLALQG